MNEELLNKIIELQQIIIQTQNELIQCKNRLDFVEKKYTQMEVKMKDYYLLKKEVEELKKKLSIKFEETIQEEQQLVKIEETNEKSLYEKKMILLMNEMREWTGRIKMNIIFDSDIDDQNVVCFQRSLMNKPSLYIILFDEKGNIFGGYNRKSISRPGKRMEDKSHFIFSLESNERIDSPIRWFGRGDKPSTCFFLNRETNQIGRLCEIGFPDGFISVAKTTISQSGCVNISNKYKGIDNDDLNNTNNEVFKLIRILVVQME
ncbi:hypothetical protein ENUP19_0055G0080 [Entamoeba nuttalli]|uniref:TLDc domain-containing protein n=2 Tax=Entamoeba nuttalli TaxID=412467 RepID=K2H035_ENTNP|nr:hypothetical protein ENU1_122800 [Entamoeba nuttalli P19]EKE39577.1 hypothetical protein ENU1_122800 [Entamoeba nuttalli P19]|eukprot:XP_008858087.1 hypothetical protein ENU1_122800 [Entamoeba nuttalli P19]